MTNLMEEEERHEKQVSSQITLHKQTN